MENIIDKLVAKKADLHVTNAWIAEKSRVPESTVTKVLNRTNKSPSFATIIPMAEVLGVSLMTQTIEQEEEKIIEQATEQVNKQITADVEKPTPSETIATELSRQYERLLEEKDRRIADKDKQIQHMWVVIAVLGALFLLCVACMWRCAYTSILSRTVDGSRKRPNTPANSRAMCRTA